MKPSPLEILMGEFMPAAQAAEIETRVAAISEPPAVVALGDLRTPIPGRDPKELLKHRFLYRGAIGLLCGPTGIGKSSFLLQSAVYWSAGRTFFGMQPGELYRERGMRVLIVQAENDEGDLAEMRDGVMSGCDELSGDEKERAGRNVMIATVTDKSGEAFAGALEALLIERGPFDLAMVDPAFAYLGGDSNSQRDVSHFMRELINPLVQRLGTGLILAHHTNKPLRGKEKDGWAAGDYAYLGAGSAEWVNPARAALAIRSIGSDSVFELRAVKRGKRLRWKDENGIPTTAQHIAHYGEQGVICWRQATAEEVSDMNEAGKGGRKRQYDCVECVHAVTSRPGECQGYYVEQMAGKLGCGETTARRMIQECVKSGWIAERGDRQFRRFEATEQGRQKASERPSVADWAPQRQNMP